MRNQPLIVLKFGGSVLLDAQRLRVAVHEIYRWRRDGYRVLAVVSALSGRTESLLELCTSSLGKISDLEQASLLAAGELESASLLRKQLDRAGIPASVLTPDRVGLVASGDPLDADPVSVKCEPIRAALESNGVVVFPGFVAIDSQGNTVTLGRGGSDLTAIFLADSLNAECCRLIKDVDGLYDRDPAIKSNVTRRYAHAGYDEALQTDGSIIQYKAVRFAKRHACQFELGRFNGIRPTTIGIGDAVIENAPDVPSILRIALCGYGTVGSGVFELANQLPELFEITGVACRTPEKHPDKSRVLTDDAAALSASSADIVVEVIGGIELPMVIAQNALSKGSHFVTANKALIAQHGETINQLAQQYGRRVLASASVGGGVPVLESLGAGQVRSVRGVLNGTGNYVLGALEQGVSLHEAIHKAQELGFAEADPSRDLDGNDSLDKLLVIAQTLGWSIPTEAMSTESITDWSNSQLGVGTTKHIALVSQELAQVKVEQVDPTSVLGQLKNEWNAAIIEFEDGTSSIVRGKGAGCWPTSESIIADLLELSRYECLKISSKEDCYDQAIS